MSPQTCHNGAPPPGVFRVEQAPSGWWHWPPVQVRCRRQAPHEPPMYVRSRLAWNLREVSGALGDLGTFLPHVIGAITVVGMAPAGILTGFGLFYIASGLFYGLPMAVQPMKAASAVVLTESMTPAAIAGAGLIIGAVFLVLGATRLIARLARIIPDAVIAGLQLGLGLSLTILGLELCGAQPWLALIIGASMLILFPFPRVPAALFAVAAGVIAGQLFGLAPAWPELTLALNMPPLIVPSWEELWRGAEAAVLPQLPLTLTNAIIVTAALARELFPKEAHPVSERNLSLTTGLGNLLTAPFGGYPMCHGTGGLAGHFRFGARTATAPVLLGAALIVLGLLFGGDAAALFKTIPDAVVGALLVFSGLELARSAEWRPLARGGFLVLLMAALTIAFNPALAFVIGLPLAWGLRRGALKI